MYVLMEYCPGGGMLLPSVDHLCFADCIRADRFHEHQATDEARGMGSTQDHQ